MSDNIKYLSGGVDFKRRKEMAVLALQETKEICESMGKRRTELFVLAEKDTRARIVAEKLGPDGERSMLETLDHLNQLLSKMGQQVQQSIWNNRIELCRKLVGFDATEAALKEVGPPV